MISILIAIVPLEYQADEKRFLYYLKTLKDKVYHKDLPEVSVYKVQIIKDLKGISVINHGHYKSVVFNHTWKQIEERLKIYFEKKPVPMTDEQKQFVLDLRF